VGIGIASIAAVAGYRLGKARADGIPADSDALTYTGLLEDDKGQPVEGSVPINVTLYTAATGGALQCESKNGAPQAPPVLVEKGRFRVPLPKECATAVRANPNLFVEVTVAAGPPLPRMRLGAVPFAVEAAHATGATSAGRVVVTSGTKSVSATGVYCGATANMTGNLGGYSGAHALCQVACGGDSTAHVCSTEELMRSGALGIVAWANKWYSTGLVLSFGGTSDMADCRGWTSASANDYGAGFISSPTLKPSYTSCSTALPVACCK
jgi:hypothetical protein